MVRMMPAFRSSRPPTKSSTVSVHRIEQHAVDGEVAALHIFARIAAEAHLIRMAAVGVADIAAKGRDLDVA